MALINGIYVFVEDEDVDKSVDTSTHPVESGIDFTDTVKRKPITMTLKGKIVYVPIKEEIQEVYTEGRDEPVYTKLSWFTSASEIIAKLNEYQTKGTLIHYEGRNIAYNMQITAFKTSHPNTIAGGCDFDMTLQEVRIAKNSYVPVPKAEGQNGGTQQVEQGDGEAVYHIVKKGDTIWYLCWKKRDGTTGDYRHLKRDGVENYWTRTRDWVIDKNPHAFSRAGDDRTMKIGAKLLVGYRK